MNKRDIILDFTSLLDIIMIILFFFIIFSHIETETAKLAMQDAKEKADLISVEAEQRLEDVNNKMLEAEEKLADADNKLLEAEEKLKEAELAGERQGQNVEGILEFSQNTNIRIKLKTGQEANNWLLEVYQGDEQLSQITSSDEKEMAKEFSAIIAKLGHSQDDTLLCEFIYDASEPGTNSAYNKVEKMFIQLRTEYNHIFYSEIDLSVFK